MRPRILLLVASIVGLLATQVVAAESAAEKTAKLVSVLKSADASFYDKARACQQLGEFGTPEAVPALAAALSDEKLSAYARSGLENIPDRAAAAALRDAAGKLKGNLLIGVVNSLGTLRDEASVGLLKQLAADSASGVSAPAMFALGRIANKDAMGFLATALASANETTRTDGAAAYLLAADAKMATKRNRDAVELYDAVRRAKVPDHFRAAATRGAIVARGSRGTELLVETLRSPELILRNAALLSIRQISSDRTAKAINAELNQAPTDLQVQLLAALADCHNKDSRTIAATKTSSDNAEIRKAALAVLGSIGSAKEVSVLLKAIANDSRPEEAEIAVSSLSQLSGAAFDAEVVKALQTAPDSATRVKFIRLVERRSASKAVPELLKLADDADAKVSVAALNALKSLATAAELPKLIALNKAAKGDAAHQAAENAIVGTATRTASESRAGNAVLDELKQTTDSALKISWARTLIALGHPPALPDLLAISRGPDSELATTVVEELASWPDPAAVEPLLELARSNANTSVRKAAFGSVVKLATTAAEEKQRPDDLTVNWLKQAHASAQTVDERRAILSGLGRVKHIEGFRLLAPYLEDKALQNEAAAAILQIATAVAPSDPVAVKAALEKIAANSSNESFRAQAAKLARSIQAKAASR